MSLPISYFLAKPLFFKDKTIYTLNKNNFVSCNIDKDITVIQLIQLSSELGKTYTLDFELNTIHEITHNTKMKVHCTCMNFKFQCKTLLWKYDSLYGPVEDDRLPKNQSKPYVCKHLYAAIILLLKMNNVNAIKNTIGEYRGNKSNNQNKIKS